MSIPHPEGTRSPGPDAGVAGMRDVWCWAVSWFRKPPGDPVKRARQAELIAALQAQLGGEVSSGALHARYAGDSRWCLETARRLYPGAWPTLGVHACTATAYGLRYVELVTGRPVDARALPAWLGEWAMR